MVLVDNHEDDYEVEACDTGTDLLSLTAVCLVFHSLYSSPCLGEYFGLL